MGDNLRLDHQLGLSLPLHLSVRHEVFVARVSEMAIKGDVELCCRITAQADVGEFARTERLQGPGGSAMSKPPGNVFSEAIKHLSSPVVLTISLVAPLTID